MFNASDEPALQRIYALIGQIATTWSEVELYWYLIFTVLMGATPRNQVDVVFFQWDTSAKQRDLILAVADAVYPNDKAGRPHKLRRRLGQLQAATNDAAGNRNAAVHSIIAPITNLAALLQGDYRVMPGANPRKPNRLAGKKLEAELKTTLTAIQKLTQDLEDFRAAILPKEVAVLGLLEGAHKLGFPLKKEVIERLEAQAEKPDKS